VNSYLWSWYPVPIGTQVRGIVDPDASSVKEIFVCDDSMNMQPGSNQVRRGRDLEAFLQELDELIVIMFLEKIDNILEDKRKVLTNNERCDLSRTRRLDVGLIISPERAAWGAKCIRSGAACCEAAGEIAKRAKNTKTASKWPFTCVPLGWKSMLRSAPLISQ
jgi:hypothetical protein